MKKICFVLVLLIIAGGCSLKHVPKAPRKPPLQVALLPMSNSSNDVKGPEVFRPLFQAELYKNGYIVMGLEKVDAILKDAGITDGGQLSYMSREALAKKLECDVLIFGEVKECFQGTSIEIIPFGPCYKNEIKVKLSMIRISDGKVLWEHTDGIRHVESLTENKKGIGGNLLGNVIRDGIKSRLEIISEQLARRMGNNMPEPYYYPD